MARNKTNGISGTRAAGAGLVAGLVLIGCVLFSLFAPRARGREGNTNMFTKMNMLTKNCKEDSALTPNDRMNLDKAFGEYEVYKNDSDAKQACIEKIEGSPSYLRLICQSSEDDKMDELKNSINNVCGTSRPKGGAGGTHVKRNTQDPTPSSLSGEGDAPTDPN